ncbi:hypothetical protein [Dokdonella soli]|uniref:Uncharacterized protein n=1 Tax=Dokdonella soli TaxID=529810 RepID=A0ABN1IJY3_9GAMM
MSQPSAAAPNPIAQLALMGHQIEFFERANSIAKGICRMQTDISPEATTFLKAHTLAFLGEIGAIEAIVACGGVVAQYQRPDAPAQAPPLQALQTPLQVSPEAKPNRAARRAQAKWKGENGIKPDGGVAPTSAA